MTLIVAGTEKLQIAAIVECRLRQFCQRRRQRHLAQHGTGLKHALAQFLSALRQRDLAQHGTAGKGTFADLRHMGRYFYGSQIGTVHKCRIADLCDRLSVDLLRDIGGCGGGITGCDANACVIFPIGEHIIGGVSGGINGNAAVIGF